MFERLRFKGELATTAMGIMPHTDVTETVEKSSDLLSELSHYLKERWLE
jgi:hypothetical protein